MTMELFPPAIDPNHVRRLQDGRRVGAARVTAARAATEAAPIDWALRWVHRASGGMPVLLSLIEGERHVVLAGAGLDGAISVPSIHPLGRSICQYVVTRTDGAPLGVADARRHPVLKGNGAVAEMGVAAYLGHPVGGAEGEVVGAICLFATHRHEWSGAVADVLEDAAGMIEAALAGPGRVH
ncbi:GAF domain-containing protein [Hasllibacter halocynthiae]|uniref:GAF domain-containing protein n=1 Tax=Hasllibacter halocynthiae TaxID=595589 RepID=A0A2T0X8Z6_9RHOB|nr:GAF domain-containing protein [Hasllibacter halocynthiae]PRY95385.1 GAF domain-containing protein [Hasllibacter halocynthiae]